jgi:transcriptional regulator with XRE-family HTH domain
MPATSVAPLPVQPPRNTLRPPDTPLGRARAARGWSQAKAARAMRLIAEQWDWEIASEASLKVCISHWENGLNRPNETYRVLLSTMYRTTPADLGFSAAKNPDMAELQQRIASLEAVVDQLAARVQASVA